MLIDSYAGDSAKKPGPVEIRLTEAHNRFLSPHLTMRHRRCFSHASSKHLLSIILGTKFCGPDGLMVDSTCDFEERSRDKEARFIKNFRPLGNSPGSALAGSFDVHQELIERTEGKYGVTGIVRMTFSPARPEDREPTGSFLWQIEPARPDEPDQGACWVELINTEETRHMGFPDVRNQALGKVDLSARAQTADTKGGRTVCASIERRR